MAAPSELAQSGGEGEPRKAADPDPDLSQWPPQRERAGRRRSRPRSKSDCGERGTAEAEQESQWRSRKSVKKVFLFFVVFIFKCDNFPISGIFERQKRQEDESRRRCRSGGGQRGREGLDGAHPAEAVDDGRGGPRALQGGRGRQQQ